MQPQLTSLPYRLDTVLDYFILLTLLAGQPWSMLMHYVHRDNLDSRYDILVATPAVIMVTHDLAITHIFPGASS